MSDEAPFTFAEDEKAAIINALFTQYPFATQAQAEAGIANNVLMNPLRTAQAIAALGGGVSMFALGVSQTGTNDPTYLEFGNTSGLNMLVFQRNSTGNYGIIFDGPMNHQKTAVIVSGARGFVKGYAIAGNEITILTYNTSNVLSDGILSSTQIVIIFFP